MLPNVSERKNKSAREKSKLTRNKIVTHVDTWSHKNFFVDRKGEREEEKERERRITKRGDAQCNCQEYN